MLSMEEIEERFFLGLGVRDDEFLRINLRDQFGSLNGSYRLGPAQIHYDMIEYAVKH